MLWDQAAEKVEYVLDTQEGNRVLGGVCVRNKMAVVIKVKVQATKPYSDPLTLSKFPHIGFS